MVYLLAYPMRVANNGTMAAIEDGTEEYYAQELAGMLRTEKGERELVPEYGVDEITASNMDKLNLASQVELFGPPVEITNVTYKTGMDGITRGTIEFDMPDVDDSDDEETIPSDYDGYEEATD